MVRNMPIGGGCSPKQHNITVPTYIPKKNISVPYQSNLRKSLLKAYLGSNAYLIQTTPSCTSGHLSVFALKSEKICDSGSLVK